jgi:hypothetical protein
VIGDIILGVVAVAVLLGFSVVLPLVAFVSLINEGNRRRRHG